MTVGSQQVVAMVSHWQQTVTELEALWQQLVDVSNALNALVQTIQRHNAIVVDLLNSLNSVVEDAPPCPNSNERSH